MIPIEKSSSQRATRLETRVALNHITAPQDDCPPMRLHTAELPRFSRFSFLGKALLPKPRPPEAKPLDSINRSFLTSGLSRIHQD